MTRWLEAAQRAKPEVLSVSSVLSVGVSCEAANAADSPKTKPTKLTEPAQGDPAAYLDHLRKHGPKPYGAMAFSLGWGATRAWQAEAKLRASGVITLDNRGCPVIHPGAPFPANAGGIQE